MVQRTTGSEDWQLIISQSADVDILTLKWLADAQMSATAQASAALRSELIGHYPLITPLGAQGLLEVEVLSCSAGQLARHPRSGKHQRVVDLRVYDNTRPEQRPWTT